MDEVLIGVQELSRRTGLPTSWIYAKAEAAELPHLKIGRYVRFRPSEVTAWLEGQRRGPRVQAPTR